MSEVASLLARGRKAGPQVSALDAVMGKDWGILSAGRARKAQEARLGLRIAHRQDVARYSGNGGAPGRKPQAVVKMIRNGGASNVKGLRAQMSYLSRQGREPLERSERYMGLEVDEDQARTMERSWRMPNEGEGRADRTSHFIVSFPEGTNKRDAHQAGRDWAEEMFGSGKYGGDTFDYYTGFHTDQAHPHMHVVVYRRGLENGEWLKVSKRGDINYDRMREELVRVAARSRIELEASTRYARGRHDRPVPDAEYRKAAAEHREPRAPDHTRETAIRAAAAMIHYSREFAANARKIEREAPEQAALLRKAAEDIKHGREVKARSDSARTSTQERTMANPSIEEKRVAVRDNFNELDRSATEVDDRGARMRLLRQIDGMKAETAPLLREPGELRAFTEKDDSGRYRGIDGSTEQRAAEKARADDKVREVAGRYGVDREATIERHAGSRPSKGLARQFAEAEGEERSRHRAERGDGVEPPEQQRTALTRMHTEIAAIYQESRDRLDGRTDERRERSEEPRSRTAETQRPPRSGSEAEELPASLRERMERDAQRARAAETSRPARGESEAEELPARVRERMERDAQRAEMASRVWQKRDAEHRAAQEREDAAHRKTEDRDVRKRGGDDPEDETRKRGRKR